MKQLSKMMLAAVASVALAAPAFAWEFSASGSAAAYFNITTEKASTDSNALSGGGVSSDGGAVTLSSSNTDGPNSATLSYSVNWADDGLDESLTISGSRKVGDWTASGNASYNLDSRGCYASATGGDNTTATATVCPAQQSAADSTAITLTDGTMTIVLGDASHLSTQNVSSGSTASGSVTFDTADDDVSVGAFVGGYEGVSLGYAISDTMSVTVAYQASSAVADACGGGDAYASEGAYHGITGTGFGFNGTFGTIGVGLTICNAATAHKGTPTESADSTGTATSTMGLGVTMDLGDIDPFISFGTYSGISNDSTTGAAGVGNEVGLTYALGDDTVILYTGSVTEISTADSTALEAKVTTGLELGYNTMVGPVGLSVGYGTKSIAQTGGSSDGYSLTDIEVAMSLSF